MLPKTLTVPGDSTTLFSNGEGFVNGNALQKVANQVYPLAIQCPADLTADTTFLVEWEYADGLWSEVRASNGASDPKTFTANASVPFDPLTAAFLKDKTIRVRIATVQATPRVFTVHYGVL